MKKIRVVPIPGTTLAENKDEAATIREDEILPALEKSERVTIDFEGIETATQSYVHALIAEAIRRHGAKAFDLLVFKNCSEGVRHIIRTVFEYTLRSQGDQARVSATPSRFVAESDGNHE